MKLTSAQQKILRMLAHDALAKKFYWTGGTLLASYYLHHRRSFDLDFFSDSPFEYDELVPFLFAVKKALRVDRIEETRIHDRWEFVVLHTDPQLRFEFVYYNHEKRRLAPLREFQGLFIDSLEDMAANKTMAYIDRNQPKDLLDVYELLIRKKFTVDELLSLVEKKFGAHFPEFLFWSESAKTLQRLEVLKPYLLETDPHKQEDFLHTVKYFFLDQGKAFLSRNLD